MKFLCVPCDSQMKLRTVGPPGGGSLSVVYACPECGYEMAMLTNPYETQLVQALGVRIGPDRLRTEGAVTGQADASAEAGGSCPFAGMIQPAEGANELERVSHASGVGVSGVPASERVGGSGGAKPPGVRWTAAAEARLAKVPEFVRPMARAGIERFARERGVLEVDETVLDAAREFFGM